MKKMNKKGFTLIELLAVIIILGVLLLIAVPSVSKYINQSKEKTYATNLSSFVDAVRNDVNAYSEGYTLSSNEYLVVPFVCIDLEKGDNTKSPFGEYDKLRSYVTVQSTDTGFIYEVAAADNTSHGIALTASSSIPKQIQSIESANIKAIEYENEAYSITSLYTGKTAKFITCDALK
jgi:prepilin-type N-terminal cleavage/methylation domain-containing protein